MKSKLVATLTMLSIVILGFGSLGQAKQITNNSREDTSPHVRGNYLTWQGRTSGNWEVFLYNIGTGETTRITSNGYGDVSPKTDGNYVVWLGFSNSGGEIFLYNISSQSTTQLTNDSNVDSRPEIANGLVVWASQEVTDSVAPGEIFLYRTATQQTEQLTDDSLDDSSPRINDDKVIWEQQDGSTTTLSLYDLPSGPSPYEAPQGFVWEDSDQTDGNLTVYSRVIDNDREIFVRDANKGSYKQITENDLQDKSPCISGNKIAWVQGEGEASEIFLASHGPMIRRFRRRHLNPGEVLSIIGNGFGENQEDSLVHINNRIYGSASPKITLWSDGKIKIKIPKYMCKWFKGKDYKKRQIWVTVDGIESNIKRIRVLKPDACP